MRPRMLLSIVVLVGMAAPGFAGGDSTAVEDRELGLSKTSVFATPEPIVAEPGGQEPGENARLGRYFSGSPPMISHRIDGFLPIRIGENLCLDCHLLPDKIGEPPEAGEPTPIPASHYTDLRRNPGKVTEKLIGARFNCTQCHAAQADTTPLVANTYAP